MRCTVFDHTVNVYGRDPATGFARRPLDNVGIQYGLKLVNNGTITPEQFVDLNEKVGGFDNDANLVPQRTVADLEAARAAYRTGRLTNGGGGLAEIPIIDYRGYIDDSPNADIHVRYHSFSMRERLEKANGHSKNQVMVVENGRAGTTGLFGDTSPVLSHALTQMDQWLTSLTANGSTDPIIARIRRARPADLVDACFTNNGTVKIAECRSTRPRRAATSCTRRSRRRGWSPANP